MAGPGQVGGRRARVHEYLHRLCAVIGGDARGRAVESVHGHHHRRAKSSGVVGHHDGELKLLEPLCRSRHAGDATAVFNDKVHRLGRAFLGSQDEVALVFAVLIIHYDNNLALPDIINCRLDAAERHEPLHNK